MLILETTSSNIQNLTITVPPTFVNYRPLFGNSLMPKADQFNLALTLPVKVPYRARVYTSLSISIDGFCVLDGRSLISPYELDMDSTNNRHIFYDIVSDSSQLSQISTFLGLNSFVHTHAFIITWHEVSSKLNQNLKQTVQYVLLTNSIKTRFVFNYMLDVIKEPIIREC
jgi:hypothetical protein